MRASPIGALIPYGVDLSGQVQRTYQWTIGHGSFTDVYKGEWSSPTSSQKIPVAIKIFRGVHHDRAKMDKIQKRLIRESCVWQTLRHPNILPYLGYCICPDVGPSMALISPFCSSGTVSDYLGHNPEADRLRLVVGVIRGIKYLHDSNVIHGDLHCHNVLVDDDGGARLSDFGRAKVIGHQGYSTTLVAGSAEYMAPELFPDDELEDIDFTEPPYSKMSDIYAFSMLSYEIFTDRTPLQRGMKSIAVHPGTTINRVLRGDRPKRIYDQHHRIPDNVWNVMEACWVREPEERLGASEIICVVLRL